MLVEKSGQLAGTPPKARVTPVKGAAKDTSGVGDDDDFDDDGSIAPSIAEGRSQKFKVEAKFEIPNYDGVVNAKSWMPSLTNWRRTSTSTTIAMRIRSSTLWDMKKSDGSAGMSYAKDVTRQCRTTPPTSGVKPWRLASPSTIHRTYQGSMLEALSRDKTKRRRTIVDTSLSLMAMLKETSLCPSNPTDKREELFTFRVQVKNKVTDAIIDPSSQKNLISENLVQRLGLSTTPHPHPYPLGWINNNIEMKIDRQCKVKFAVTDVYIDEMLCEVVPLNICNLIFGSPYLWDRDATFFRRPQQYQFIKDGQKFVFTIEPLSTTIDLVTTCQAKRMINACQKFVLLVIRPIISEEANSKILSLACNKNIDDTAKLIGEHQDLFQEVQGLPPK
uniref:Uncharacterized protein n=1 Tax=Ananas comosus var. bracteatus TaxID=296719 RepID=A0A6V7QBW7_ANACO|nr:unnamed protein product [Ananas comosus var. bracteatus]